MDGVGLGGSVACPRVQRCRVWCRAWPGAPKVLELSVCAQHLWCTSSRPALPGPTPAVVPEFCISCRRHATVAAYLLREGADPLACDWVHMRTCLHYAAMAGQADCLRLLCSANTQVRQGAESEPRLLTFQMQGPKDGSRSSFSSCRCLLCGCPPWALLLPKLSSHSCLNPTPAGAGQGWVPCAAGRGGAGHPGGDLQVGGKIGGSLSCHGWWARGGRQSACAWHLGGKFTCLERPLASTAHATAACCAAGRHRQATHPGGTDWLEDCAAGSSTSGPLAG